MKNTLMALLGILWLSSVALAETKSGMIGTEGDAYLKYTVSGGDFSKDTDGNHKWKGTSFGDTVTFEGEMSVTVPKGLVSYVIFSAYLGTNDNRWDWPPKGTSNRVQGPKTVTKSFFLSYTPTDGEPYVLGTAELTKGGGVTWRPYAQVQVNPALGARNFGEAKKKCRDEKVDSGARFSSISREVEIFPDCDPDDVRFATTRSIIYDKDHVVTGEDSNAVISFKDLSTLMLKGDSEVIIAARPMLETRKGSLWVNLKKVIRGEPVEVKSNLGTLGIKGTTIVFEVTEDSSILKVLEGEVSFTAKATGETVELAAGETVIATSEGLSEKTTFDVDAEQGSWDELGNDAIVDKRVPKAAEPVNEPVNRDDPQNKRSSTIPETPSRNRQPEVQETPTDDGWAPIGESGSSAIQNRGDNSKRDGNITKGHSTPYGF